MLRRAIIVSMLVTVAITFMILLSGAPIRVNIVEGLMWYPPTIAVSWLSSADRLPRKSRIFSSCLFLAAWALLDLYISSRLIGKVEMRLDLYLGNLLFLGLLTSVILMLALMAERLVGK